MTVSESSHMHQLRRRSAQKPQLDCLSRILQLRLRIGRLLDPSNRHYRRGREEDRPCRSSLGRASLTFSGRPPNSLPSKLLMAARPSASLPNVMNANPLGWPVSLSVTILISVTLPNCSKIC